MRTHGNYRHGCARHHAQTKEYRAWAEMKKRCLNPRSSTYYKYGARGITVCERWKNSFLTFLADVGLAPTPQHTLDRIDGSGDYRPGNVRWATPQEQARNTRQNVRYDWDGRSLTLGQWSEITGIKRRTLSQRIHGLGWNIERTLTTPCRVYQANPLNR